MTVSSILSHPFTVSCRNSLRRSEWLRSLYVRWVARRDYEERFGTALLEEIRPGDTVWDIGANVGLYAAKFLERRARHVVCFEPAPEAQARLRDRFAHELTASGQLSLVPVALGCTRGSVRFAADGASPTNRIAASGEAGTFVEVPMRTGDEAQRELALPWPDVIKIDVEGYEPDVLDGLSTILGSHSLRAVFVEVHFSLLHERGLDAAPARMVSLLRDRGFLIDWLDASHFRALRHAGDRQA